MSSSGKVGELLVSQGMITVDQLNEAIELRKKSKETVQTILVRLGYVNENILVTFLSKQYGITAISLDDVRVPQELTKMIPWDLCERHILVPISSDGKRLSIALSDPSNVSAVDDIRFLCNMEINIFIARESAIRRLIRESYPKAAKPQEEVKTVDPEEESDGKTGTIEIGLAAATEDIEAEVIGEKPVIRLINKLLIEAIRRKASDIHIEPFETFSRIRFRIDGALHEIMQTPPQMRTAVPSRIKVMSSLNISEKRLPQDGRLQVRTKSKKLDIRVSTLPTIFGEKVVMRLLDQGNTTPTLESVGFEEEQMKLFRKAAVQPYGMVLVTGPTGSGKSTTLYAALSELNSPDVNISTVEDPVEYNMAGINQCQMKDGIGLNFAAALKSLLRQDPDIIMVGEIRDHETAEIAIKSALTGHMVFSTLHTNDAPSTITRLLHMGVEPFLITAALTLVQAQRLIRANCQRCAEPDPKVTKEELLAAEMPESWLESCKPMRGTGCPECSNTGFKGRKGIFEVMYLTENLREMVVKNANADQLKVAAMQEGMLTLRQSSLIKLYRGETTLEEVLNNTRPDRDIKI
jgi:type IV pilus assembly protein PilB